MRKYFQAVLYLFAFALYKPLFSDTVINLVGQHKAHEKLLNHDAKS